MEKKIEGCFLDLDINSRIRCNCKKCVKTRNAMTEEFISILENKQKQINDEVDAHIKRTKGFENIQEDEEGKLELIKELIKELKRND